MAEVYLVESNEEELNLPQGVSRGVLAENYPHGLYLHLIQLTDAEMHNLVPITGSHVRLALSADSLWWFGDKGAKARWPGISDPYLTSQRKPVRELLARNAHR